MLGRLVERRSFREPFMRTLTADVAANLIRNVWSYAIIFCGHFPDQAYTFTQEETADENRGAWYVRQLTGAANIDGGPVFHVISGNLGYQVEHHLFPDMPSTRYGEIAPKVREICQRYGLPYNSGPFHQQLGMVQRTIIRLAFPGGKHRPKPGAYKGPLVRGKGERRFGTRLVAITRPARMPGVSAPWTPRSGPFSTWRKRARKLCPPGRLPALGGALSWIVVYRTKELVMAWKRNFLVVANVTAASEELIDVLQARAGQETCGFTLVIPATPFAGGREAATEKLGEALEQLRAAGLEAEGSVGNADPILAVTDAWDPKKYDEIVVSTLPMRFSKWLHAGLPERISKLTDAPVTHVVSQPPRAEHRGGAAAGAPRQRHGPVVGARLGRTQRTLSARSRAPQPLAPLR